MAKPTKEITQLKDLQPASDSAAVISPWSPLAEPIFRALWIATVASNIGTWMQDVGESWLMVSLTTSPMLVALVETAGSLPIVLLALPAGALADVVDRRRLLLITQSWMLVSAAVMGVLDSDRDGNALAAALAYFHPRAWYRDERSSFSGDPS